jgi:transposase-like protein
MRRAAGAPASAAATQSGSIASERGTKFWKNFLDDLKRRYGVTDFLIVLARDR